MHSARPDRVLFFWLLCLVLMAASGCSETKGGPAARVPAGYSGDSYGGGEPSSPSSAPVQPRTAEASVDVDGAPSPAPRADVASRDVGSAERREARQRPGLGTEFGEARTSRVHDVAFVRDSSRPFAVTSLHYNDRRGVDALASSARRRESFRSIPSGGGAVTISVRDADGEPLEAVHVGDRMFVVGAAGQRYSIVLENHTGHRFEAACTVDGLDVVNGKPGTLDNRGYVLMPFATVTIDGFRTSTAEVAAFRFASVADSYAAQTGSARNVGVIGLAFFAERGDSFVPDSEVRLRETASPFPADSRFAQPPRR
ncbi:MAG: putative outer rane lipoprotein [Labilithrix sp.]|nr:putative outer rane lipoprotein [Labilithrix sp.]